MTSPAIYGERADSSEPRPPWSRPGLPGVLAGTDARGRAPPADRNLKRLLPTAPEGMIREQVFLESPGMIDAKVGYSARYVTDGGDR